jgi:hypothetical protein
MRVTDGLSIEASKGGVAMESVFERALQSIQNEEYVIGNKAYNYIF